MYVDALMFVSWRTLCMPLIIDHSLNARIVNTMSFVALLHDNDGRIKFATRVFPTYLQPTWSPAAETASRVQPSVVPVYRDDPARILRPPSSNRGVTGAEL